MSSETQGGVVVARRPWIDCLECRRPPMTSLHGEFENLTRDGLTTEKIAHLRNELAQFFVLSGLSCDVIGYLHEIDSGSAGIVRRSIGKVTIP